MEFAQRGNHQTQPVAAAPAPGAPAPSSFNKSKKNDGNKWIRLSAIVLLFSIAILLIAVILSLATGGPKDEDSYVNDGQYQAVFLNGGQVYFGQIKSLNAKYLRIQDIYYLRVNQTVQPNQSSTQAANDVSLVKLGCELHGPQDEMLVNREHVIFWENLKTDGQVANAVAKYKEQNPNGQKCETTATDTGTGTETTPTP